MDMNLQKYIAFAKTAECGSFTRAAEMLNYSQSGVSRMIGDLEKEWRLALLERGRGGVRLTSDGMKLLPLVQSVCGECRKLQSRVDELNGLQSGVLRIGAFSSVATHWLPKIVKEFQRDYPNIEYEFFMGDYAEIERLIAEGRVDCGFVRLPTLPEFDTVFLERDRLLAVLPEDHPLAGSEPFPVKALCDYPLILFERGTGSEMSEIFEEHGIRPDVHFTVWDDYAIMSMVESGLGIGILPALILRRAPYRIAVKELDIPVCRRIGIAMRDRKSAPLAARRFLDYLRYRND
ncbi:MAG: LysR family transcriptional regulator [Clostridiales Family XIII bacterium]|jgi:DNA-binding transcriptional LysR family regulator|nr:LysR family transcriptional regulator [Clostridiales Family XIII bacterium]